MLNPSSVPAARAVLFAVLLVGCHSMRQLTPEEVGSARTLDRIWVTRADQSVLLVNAPEVRGDTLVGFVDGKYQEMPLSQAVTLKVRERDPGRTAALVGGAAGATVAALIYFENRSYVSPTAQTCSSGNTTGDVADNLPVACCRVQPNTPC